MIVLLRPGLATLARQFLVELPNFRRDLQFHVVNNILAVQVSQEIVFEAWKCQSKVCSSQCGSTSLEVKVTDSAEFHPLCVRTIDNYIATKELPCRRLGKRVLIPYSALVAFARRDQL